MISHAFAVLALLVSAVQPTPSAADATAVVSGATVAVYAVINNPTMYDIYVTSATSDAAGKVEIYAGDKPVSDATVSSYGSLELKAGGTFLRLSDLKREPKAGDAITVTMMTDGGVQIVATAVVKF